jgi:predicted nuclease of predicted toxin-antitoxin system
MRLVADEGVSRHVVSGLRSAGYDVTSVAETSPGDSDESVLALARTLDAVLITTDKDFGDLVYRQRLVHRGVLLLRLHGTPVIRQINDIRSFLAEHAEQVQHSFSVLDKSGVRIRRQHD